MSFEQQVRKIEANLTQQFKKLLSPTKKNIVFFCPDVLYYKQLGNLAQKLGQKHNVILAKAFSMPPDFEAQFAATIFVAWEAETPEEKEFQLQINIKEIDLIVELRSRKIFGISDAFLSQNAKRIYMPHSMLQASKDSYDYVIAPTKMFVECYQRIHAKTDNLILAGYPKFDLSLNQIQFQQSTQIPDKLTYAPTLRNDAEETSMYPTALYAGYDSNLLEWLLENSDKKIAYRPHPFVYSSEYASKAYQLLKSRFDSESRLIIDETPGSGFYAQTQTLITDFSTTAYTFSLSTLRPSIFFAPFLTSLYDNNIEMAKHIHRIGTIAKNFRELKQILNKNEDKSQEIAAFRDECVFNVGKSEEAICEAIDSILNT